MAICTWGPPCSSLLTYPGWLHLHIPLGPDDIVLVWRHGDSCSGTESRISRPKSPEKRRRKSMLITQSATGEPRSQCFKSLLRPLRLTTHIPALADLWLSCGNPPMPTSSAFIGVLFALFRLRWHYAFSFQDSSSSSSLNPRFTHLVESKWAPKSSVIPQFS